jgi:hypothetical protein
MGAADEELSRPCVGSGFCCKVAPCPFGTAGESGGCVHLVPWAASELRAPRYRCGIHAEIVKDASSEVSPAFGAGCSSTMFNEPRRAILVELRVRGVSA